MARDESDREDLLREATALVERAEFRFDARPGLFTAGFRRDGGLSLFFGADPVYQFNAAGELRRAFVAGELYKARSGRLVVMRRERTADQVLLVSHELSEQAKQTFLRDLGGQLDELRGAIEQACLYIIRQVPDEWRPVERHTAWLASRSIPVRVAASPRAGS